jgi:hypothetical protein
MKELIKKILKEELSQEELFKKILNYYGDDKSIKDLWVKVWRKEPISDTELENAEKLFQEIEKSEKTKKEKNISSRINSTRSLQTEIKKEGIETYLNLIKSNKKFLLESLILGSKFKIGSPSDKWYETNIDDLEKIDEFDSTAGIITWADKSKATFEEKIDEMIFKCENKNYWGILETEGDKVIWSLLNKIDTNYVNWGSMIEEKYLENLISGKSDSEVIHEYFKQRPVSQILNTEMMGLLQKTESRKQIKIKTLSLAELDLLESFKDLESIKMKSVFSRILKTTEEGDLVEEKFKELLNNLPENVQNINNFSTWGNIVDMVFGIDLTATINGTTYAIQVKKNKDHAEKAFIRKLGIPFLAIYPKNKTELKKYNFEFISNNTHGSFNDEFYRKTKKQN